MMKKDRLDTLSKERTLLLVANGGYASHYNFTPEQWLRTREVVRSAPNLIEMNKKLQKVPVNVSWDRP